MPFTHTITRGYKDSSGVTISSVESQTDNAETNYDNPIAPSTTFALVNRQFTVSAIKMLELYSDKALLVAARQATTQTVAGVTNTSSVDVQINITAHGRSVGDLVDIVGVGGATDVNGFWYVTVVVDADHFKISATKGGSNLQGNGAAYTSGGTSQLCDQVNLVAGQNLVYNSNIPTDTLVFTANIDNLYVTNASSTDTANFRLRSLLHE